MSYDYINTFLSPDKLNFMPEVQFHHNFHVGGHDGKSAWLIFLLMPFVSVTASSEHDHETVTSLSSFPLHHDGAAVAASTAAAWAVLAAGSSWTHWNLQFFTSWPQSSASAPKIPSKLRTLFTNMFCLCFSTMWGKTLPASDNLHHVLLSQLD